MLRAGGRVHAGAAALEPSAAIMIARTAPFCPQCGAPTEAREKFGRSRPVCTRCGETVFFDPKVAVVAFVVRPALMGGDELLMIERANDPGKGRWSLPAGFVDPDEAPAAAAERETLEETGLVVQAGRLITVLHRPDPDGLADLVLVYAALWTGGNLCAGDDAAAVGWFGRDALPEIALASTHLLVTRWRSGDL
ncbi:MAG: NUDIX domain-containing protein [bacterium]|nr:NUDIX domain-containing protein [bacterium]